MAMEIFFFLTGTSNTGGRYHGAWMRISIISSCGWKLLPSAFSPMSPEVHTHTDTHTDTHVCTHAYRLPVKHSDPRWIIHQIKDTLLAWERRERERKEGRERAATVVPSFFFIHFLPLPPSALTGPAAARKYRTTSAASSRTLFCHCHVIDSAVLGIWRGVYLNIVLFSLKTFLMTGNQRQTRWGREGFSELLQLLWVLVLLFSACGGVTVTWKKGGSWGWGYKIPVSYYLWCSRLLSDICLEAVSCCVFKCSFDLRHFSIFFNSESSIGIRPMRVHD